MLLLVYYDGTLVEIEDCEDVVHDPGGLICVDYLGASLATFTDDEILGYTLDPHIIGELRREQARSSGNS